MRSLDATAVTDRGRTRKRNEDAYHVGDSVFAVADGMGGHLAGDVASATALLPVKSLDGQVFPDPATAQAALLDAVLAANAAVVRKAADEPDLRGMGTTLTAAIVEGRRLHVAHVGDSRAYLFRDGDLVRLTRDHTLVAHLIEEGQITEEEAAHHPHRSIITRAIGVDVDLDVDTLTIDLQDGDQILLCSDGLTGPVDDTSIEEVLSDDLPIADAATGLVEAANHAGGPDNITVVLLRYEDDEHREPARVPAATVIRPDATTQDGDGQDERDWARKIGRMGALGRRAVEDDSRRDPVRRQRVLTTIAVLIALVVLAALGGWWLLSRSYFVGLDGDRVAIFHGVPADLGPVELYWVAEETDLAAGELPAYQVNRFEEGVAAADLRDARTIVENAPRRDDGDRRGRSAGGTPDPSPSKSP